MSHNQAIMENLTIIASHTRGLLHFDANFPLKHTSILAKTKPLDQLITPVFNYRCM